MAVGDIIKGIESLISRGLTVETLDAAAISLALLRGNYFTAGTITTMLALGQYLEGQERTTLYRTFERPDASRRRQRLGSARRSGTATARGKSASWGTRPSAARANSSPSTAW